MDTPAIRTELIVYAQMHILLSAVAAGITAGLSRGITAAEGGRTRAKTTKTTGY